MAGKSFAFSLGTSFQHELFLIFCKFKLPTVFILMFNVEAAVAVAVQFTAI